MRNNEINFSERELVQALINYTVGVVSEGELYCFNHIELYHDFFPSGTLTEKEKIQYVWESFFSLIKRDEPLYNQIFILIQKCYQDGLIDLDRYANATCIDMRDVLYFEQILVYMLRAIAPKYNRHYNSGILRLLEELEKRALSSVKEERKADIRWMMYELQQARVERNRFVYDHADNGNFLKSHINAYFICTIIYDIIKKVNK